MIQSIASDVFVYDYYNAGRLISQIQAKVQSLSSCGGGPLGSRVPERRERVGDDAACALPTSPGGDGGEVGFGL